MSWEIVELDKVATSVDYGLTASAKVNAVGPKFLRITDIQDDSVDWNSVPYCDAEPKSITANLLRDGDIVFARTGATTGKSFLVRNPPARAVFASYLIRVQPSPRIDAGYLAHFFKTPDYWSQISNSARGAAQPGVNSTVLKRLKVPLPPLKEQRRIAAILDAADALRAKRRAALAKLDTLPQSIFIEMFGDPEINSRAWPLCELKDLLSEGMRNGVSPSSKGNIVLNVLTLSAITGAAYDDTAFKEGKFEAYPHQDQRVNCKKFLICRGNGNKSLVGRGFFPEPSDTDVIFPDTMISAAISAEKMDRYFFEVLWNSSVTRAQIESVARTTNGTFKVNQSSLCQIRLVCPDLSLQTKFSDKLRATRQQIRRAQCHAKYLESLFASLQMHAFHGKLTGSEFEEIVA